MKLRLIAVVSVLLVLCAAHVIAVPDTPSKFVIEGAWQPVPATDGSSVGWLVLPDRLQLDLPAKTAGEFAIVRSDPLPDGDWTLDIWAAAHAANQQYDSEMTVTIGRKGQDDYMPMRLSMRPHQGDLFMTAEKPGGNSLLQRMDRIPAAAGPIYWIRISYSRQTGRVKARINGMPVTGPDATASLPPSPIEIKLKTWAKETPFALEIRGFQVTPGAEPDTAYMPGIAFGGWRKQPEASRLMAVPDLDKRLQSLCADPRLTPAGRAYALAATILAEKASSGRIGPERWRQVAEFMPTVQSDLPAALCLLPIAAACGDGAQRAEVRAWLQPCTQLRPDAWRKIERERRSLVRASTLDPVLGADICMLNDKDMDLRLLRSLSAQLAATDPAYALALQVFFQGHNSFEYQKLAWMLPEIRAVSPAYYSLIVPYMRERMTDRTQWKDEPGTSLSYAAYRMLPTNPGTAMELLALIPDPRLKADALQYMSDNLPATVMADVGKTIENELKAAISSWKATEKEPSPVPQYIRLAKWYESRGQAAEAASTVRACTDKLGGSASPRFRDARDIAKMMSKLKLPEADEWAKKASDHAVEADSSGSESAGDLYVSAAFLMVTDLLSQNRVGEALDLTNRIDPESMGQNREMALSAIIQHVARTDVPQALALLKDFPQNRRRNSVITRLLPLLGEKNLDTILSLFETVTPESKPAVAFKIAEVVPIARNEQIRTLCETGLADMLKRSPGAFDTYVGGTAETWISKLDVATLFSLESLMSEQYDRFAYQMLINVVTACGLDEDPIWQAYHGVYNPNGGTLPWGSGSLRYAILSEAEQTQAKF